MRKVFFRHFPLSEITANQKLVAMVTRALFRFKVTEGIILPPTFLDR